MVKPLSPESDMYDLIAKVQKEVHTRFGVTLEPEVIFLGEFD